MQVHHFIHLMDSTRPGQPSKMVNVQWASALSSAELEQAIIYEWIYLQQIPSYFEELLNANHDLIEDIATQI